MTGIHAPTLDDIERLARAALRRIPDPLRAHVEGVVMQVVEFPDDETMKDMELETPFDILGLYSGIPPGHKDGGAIARQPDMIFLYRRPILDYWCETGEELAHVVRHVVIHEIGHHFGLSDEDMEALEEMED